MSRSIVWKISESAIDGGLLTASLLARVLAMLPKGTTITGMREYSDFEANPLGPFGSGDVHGSRIRLTSPAFEEVAPGCMMPELDVTFHLPPGSSDRDEAEITLKINGSTPAWALTQAPNPVATLRQRYLDIRDQRQPSQELRQALQVCQCDVEYLGGHWPHCKDRSRR